MMAIVIIEDHPVFREGLARLVSAEADMRVLAAASSVEEVLQGVAEAPAVVVLDLNLPGLSGPLAVKSLTERGWPVLVVSAAGRRDDVLDALAAGAYGYLTKDSEPTEILAAVRTVANHGTYVSPTLASYLLQAIREPGGDKLALSAREKQVLALVAQGETDIDIAEMLFISVRTVQSHLDRIRDKTGQRRRPDLTRLAIEHGLIRNPREDR